VGEAVPDTPVTSEDHLSGQEKATCLTLKNTFENANQEWHTYANSRNPNNISARTLALDASLKAATWAISKFEFEQKCKINAAWKAKVGYPYGDEYVPDSAAPGWVLNPLRI